ncbi:hypothetical protein C8R47DRAFT_757219 [Mycena vitilis]|nr:hypothetical protein C8R47DRAFT_757219 [Mycena vitilis]
MASDTPVTFEVHAYFLDNHHPLGNKPNLVYNVQGPTFRGMQVAHLLNRIEEQHRSDCKLVTCDICHNLGPIIVKSGWLLDHIPDAGFDTVISKDGKQSMTSAFCIAPYIKPHQRDTGGVVILLLECGFDGTDPPRANEEPRRPEAHSDDDEANRPKTAKVELSPLDYKRLLIMKSVEDPCAPLNVLSPSLPYAYWKGCSGVVGFDKTEYIVALDTLLRAHPCGCLVIGPIGTGKSTLLQTLHIWYDIEGEIAVFLQCFENTAIKAAVDKRTADLAAGVLSEKYRYFWSSQQQICLMFDFAQIQIPDVSVATAEKIVDKYLLNTIQAFIIRYHHYLGPGLATSIASPAEMVAAVFERVEDKNLRLFIGVDHWDAPILDSLSSTSHGFAKYIASYISKFIRALSDRGRTSRVAKLLVLGNIPLFMPGDIQDISLHGALKGAFGISNKELNELFAVLSHNRHTKPLRNSEELAWTLGRYSPPSMRPGDDPSPAVYGFPLVLNYVATALDLDNSYKILQDSPRLKWISQRCQHLLQYSGLRQARQITIRRIKEFDVHSLVRCLTNEVDLRILSFFLGAIKVVDPGKGPDSALWIMELSSQFARDQLLSSCSVIAFDQSQWDIIYRALLERDPYPLVQAVSTRLSGRPVRSLYRMQEGGFQEMLDSFHEPGWMTETKPGTEKRDFTNHYFSQVGLLTDFRKYRKMRQDQEEAKRKKASGKANKSRKAAAVAKPKISGTGAFGYLDILLVALRDLHPGRVIAIELKFISLFQIFRALHKSHRECDAAVRGEGGKSFTRHCLDKLEELDNMSEADLQRVTYWCWDSDEEKGKDRQVSLTVGEGTTQLRTYMDAIVKGNANHGHSEPSTEGITYAEKRVQANRNPEHPVDEVVGFVICVVGRRAITIPVDPTVQNTHYRYDAVQGWKSVFEKRKT